MTVKMSTGNWITLISTAVMMIVGSLVTYFKTTGDARVERAVTRQVQSDIIRRLELLEASKPELLTVKFAQFTKEFDKYQENNAVIIQLLNEINESNIDH